MLETQPIDGFDLIQKDTWSQYLQRRVLRLLFLYDERLFRNQFRQFFAASALPQLPLLQQYDRFLRLRILSAELLDDILPRIRRQLSLKSSHLRLLEEAPTRGEVDWQRTLEYSWRLTPGQPPLQFETLLRQQNMHTPENLLTVAILLACQQELHHLLAENNFADEDFRQQESSILIGIGEQLERELAAPYARALEAPARQASLSSLLAEVEANLRPGQNPYRDLLNWWRQFAQFRTGRLESERELTLAPKRDDEKTSAWLYELWIMLEMLHFLESSSSIEPQDVATTTDQLACVFRWKEQRLRLFYNRQLDTSTSFVSDWEHGPASRPDYTIERADPLEIRHNGQLLWREPPFVLDAKYYLGGSDPAHTHGPIKKLLGDMALLGTEHGALFFPLIQEPANGQSITRTIRRRGKQYMPNGVFTQQIHLYRITPAMPVSDLQARLSALLDLAVAYLPRRPAPVCRGVWADPDTINATRQGLPSQTIICPKPHIGTGVFDLVNVETDCLKNPQVCHVIGQPIVAPYVVRVSSYDQLAQRSKSLRSSNSEQLAKAEADGDEERAERIRDHIFLGVGKIIEHYVNNFGNPRIAEESLRWIFGAHWQEHTRCLDATTRNALISGEQVWQHYQNVHLQDWAAPAIQFCRALEHELKRRLYTPFAASYPSNTSGFTLGTVEFAYGRHNKNALAVWGLFLQAVRNSGSDILAFEQIAHAMVNGGLKDKRNQLAHGTAIPYETAVALRELVLGKNRSQPGILCWLAESLEPA